MIFKFKCKFRVKLSLYYLVRVTEWVRRLLHAAFLSCDCRHPDLPLAWLTSFLTGRSRPSLDSERVAFTGTRHTGRLGGCSSASTLRPT
jgi:hypothetical protein